MDSIRELIIQEIESQITTATAGAYGPVYRGRTYFTPNELPAVALLPGVEASERSYGEQNSEMPVVVHAVQIIGDNNPSVLGELALAEMVKALMSPSASYTYLSDIAYTGGGVEDYPSNEDQAIVVVINLSVKYSANIGDPYNQTNT